MGGGGGHWEGTSAIESGIAKHVLCEACSALLLHDVSPRAINLMFERINF